MSSATSSASALHQITNTNINTAPSVTLTSIQQQHVGLVLDLFQAKGTMSKLKDWLTDDAVYEDLFATAEGRDQVAGQFLGLPVVTKSSETISHRVTSVKPFTSELAQALSSRATHTASISSNSNLTQIEVEIHHKFTFKPLGNEVHMNSILVIVGEDKEGGKIIRIQDRPTTDIPENSILTFMRKMNAQIAPHLLGIPQNEEQDRQKAEKFGAI